MIRIFIILSIILCGFITYAQAEDTVSQYMVGGENFVPDAEYFFTLCHDPEFTCRPVRRGETWEELYPNKQQRDLVMRLNRTNVPLQYRTEILLPKDISKLNYQALSPFPEERDTHGKKLLYIDLDKFAFAAYDADGHQVLWGPASGGKPWCDDTQASCLSATGDYHIYRMKGEDCHSGTYPLDTKGGAEMPYCMYYYKGFAIHASTLSGFINRSRGCVRLFDADAKWLNQDFVKLGTEVIVKQ